jgi:hypothetical protein
VPEEILTGYIEVFLGFDPSFKEQFAGPALSKPSTYFLSFECRVRAILAV